jgi:tetratricopeptide (TPR) repeat protein
MRKLLLTVFFVAAVPLVAAQTVDPLAAAFKASYEAEAKGDYNEAYRVIYNVIGAQPSSYEGVMRLGYIKGMQNQPRDAVLLYGRAAELEAGAVEPYIYQQYQYILLGDWTGLESSAKAALTRDQQNYTSRSRLGYALYMQGKFSEAAEQYVRLGRLYPLDLDVLIMRGWSYAKSGQKALAQRAFRRALTISPENASAKEGLEFTDRLR